MNKNTHIGTITKLELLRAPAGHSQHVTGTGVWRNKRKQPKGGRGANSKKAIYERMA